MAQGIALQSVEYARLATNVAAERQASDIALLDIRDLSSFADYFVILSVDSARQLSSLAEQISAALKERGASVHHREGSPQGGWVLLDYGDVVIHLFRVEVREFYDLEGAWSRAVEVVRFQ